MRVGNEEHFFKTAFGPPEKLLSNGELTLKEVLSILSLKLEMAI